MNKELLKGYTDILLLSLLKDEAKYGYQIAKEIRDRTGNLFELKEGTLYPALQRLERNGYVDTTWGETSEGGRRKYYRLTEAGRKHLVGCRREWQCLRQVIDMFIGGGLCNE
ncbi:MAG: helix-turn-helix transcriptional regulator [Bacillota bacterium]